VRIFFKKMVNFLKHDNFIAKIQIFELVALHKAKEPYMDKLPW
jgi:hypothetical protein